MLETRGPASALVFPRYIVDPSVGLHFGRARGPFVEAAANGLAMCICAVAAALLALAAPGAGARLPALVIVLCAVGIVFCAHAPGLARGDRSARS